MAKPVGIIEMGTPPESVVDKMGRQGQWFIDALQLEEGEYQIFRPEHGDELPNEDAVSCVIISGSWSMVTEKLAWSEAVAEWIRTWQGKIPMFGVCYGHQIMAHALGGVVDFNPNGREKGLYTITKKSADPYLDAATEQTYTAWLSHDQSVIKAPACAVSLAESEKDSNQMLRYDEKTYSVQFHPEFTAPGMIACWQSSDELSDEKIAQVLSTEEPAFAHSIMRRFISAWR